MCLWLRGVSGVLFATKPPDSPSSGRPYLTQHPNPQGPRCSSEPSTLLLLAVGPVGALTQAWVSHIASDLSQRPGLLGLGSWKGHSKT